jgi:hypothetical protein
MDNFIQLTCCYFNSFRMVIGIKKELLAHLTEASCGIAYAAAYRNVSPLWA